MAREMVDYQRIGCAGEFLTAGQLFKRDYQVAVTYGNAKAIDLLAIHPKSGKALVVQVKTQHKKNCFPIKFGSIVAEHVYVFVRLNQPSEAEEFFIVRGATILAEPCRFFGSSMESKVPAVNYGSLTSFKNNWGAFDDVPAPSTAGALLVG